MFLKFLPEGKVKSAVEWVIALGLALLAYFFLRNFVYSTAEISGPSMNPTLEHGEKVIVNRMAYWFSSPEKNDIVAFPYPSGPDENYVKRIIGIPGDEIDIFRGKVYINGEEFTDSFSPEELMPSGDVVFPIYVGDNEYFVLGDNRDNSKDSRYSTVGCIDEEDILGKISFRFWPFEKIGIIN